MFKDIQQYIHSCHDCETSKPDPTPSGRSPGNLTASYPIQLVEMDHVPSLPESYQGQTELLVWVDHFTGFVIAKATASREAQVIAAAYEECVFRLLGASEAIRHDREPGFMSEVFAEFNRMMGQRQRATLAYIPQAHRLVERMVQTIIRAIKKYIADGGQRDWDLYANVLALALTTASDRIRRETPFYLVHGWDPKTSLEASIPIVCDRTKMGDPKAGRGDQ